MGNSRSIYALSGETPVRMNPNTNRPEIRDAVDESTLRSSIRLLLAAVGLLFLLFLVSLLPGLDRLVPQTPVSFAALVGAVVTLAVVGLLVFLAPMLASLVRVTLGGPKELVEHLASVVLYLVLLVAVLVAHQGLGAAVTPFLGGATWGYDIAFLLLSLPPLVVVAVRLYAALDPATDLLTRKVTTSSAWQPESDETDGGTADGGADEH